MLKRPAILFAGLLFAAVLLFGLMHLFELRLDRGDIYPPYSTLRTDPLGASVLYESLEQLPDLAPQRYYEETFKIDDGPDHALFILGAEPLDVGFISRPEYDKLQRFVYDGGRLVVAYQPYPEADPQWLADPELTNHTEQVNWRKKRRNRELRQNDTNQTEKAGINVSTNTPGATNEISKTGPAKKAHDRNSRRAQKTPDGNDSPEEEDEQVWRKKYVDLKTEWGFHFKTGGIALNEDGSYQFPDARLAAGKTDLPAKLVLHTSMYFHELTNGWTAIYERGGTNPVIIERKMGAGSVVLIADAYPFSNEAMFKDRSSSLLAWSLGGRHELIFEEAHLGVVERPGMATLMRRYQLHGLIISLILVAGLFVWKNSISLVPPYEEAKEQGGLMVMGRDSASGFVNLVRRSVSPAEIINVCFAEWKKSGARVAAMSPAQRRDLEQLIQQQATIDPKQRKPVENYRVISQILKRRK